MTRSQIVKRSLAALLGAFLLAYVADYIYLRIRMIHPKPTDPFESMVRNRLLAIPQKNGMLDYEVDQVHPTDTLTCVHSLFPHYGDPPCWYLKPRINDPISVGTVLVGEGLLGRQTFFVLAGRPALLGVEEIARDTDTRRRTAGRTFC